MIKYIKKLLMITAVVLFTGMLPVVSANADTSGDYEYNKNADGKTATITKYNGGASEIVIPDTIGELTVTRIKEWAFKGKSFTSVVIPDTVNSIGNNAFAECESLSKVKFSAGVTTIGTYAFGKCKALSELIFPEGSKLSSIGNEAFRDCTSLSKVVFPDSLTTIGTYAFYGCKGITKIELGVNSVSEGAFKSCTSLKEVNLSDGVTSIGKYAFMNCTGLKLITIPASVTSIADNSVGYKYYYEDMENGGSVKNGIVTNKYEAGSTAEEYAKTNKLDYILADTPDVTHHAALTKVDAKAATRLETGNIEYY